MLHPVEKFFSNEIQPTLLFLMLSDEKKFIFEQKKIKKPKQDTKEAQLALQVSGREPNFRQTHIDSVVSYKLKFLNIKIEINYCFAYKKDHIVFVRSFR